jgi:hypothetical protein
MDVRQRSCTDRTGCGAWRRREEGPYFILGDGAPFGVPTVLDGFVPIPRTGTVSLRVRANANVIAVDFDSPVVVGTNGGGWEASSNIECGTVTGSCTPNAVFVNGANRSVASVGFSGDFDFVDTFDVLVRLFPTELNLTSSCVQLIGIGSTTKDADGRYIEFQAAYTSRDAAR